MENIIRLPQMAWHGTSDLELQIPEEWRVKVCQMAGHNRRVLTPAEIREAVKSPLGSPPIRLLARERKQVAVIFDDMARVTRVSQIVPFIIEELAEAGIPDENIRFIAATGCHGVMDRSDFVKKLGEEVLHRFPVYNHNPFSHCVKAGTTSLGIEIYVNEEVMRCDLKIAIGSIVPHLAAGFSGGSKIVLPGICSIQTIAAFHQLEAANHRYNFGKPSESDNYQNNPPRLNMDEAAGLIGLDIKIDTIMNSRGETVAVYAGSPKAYFMEAVKDAKSHYLTHLSTGNDIVIANTFAKASEFEAGVSIAFPSVRNEGGDVVLIANAPEGHVSHYLFGPWGSEPHVNQTQINIRPNVNRLFILTGYPDLTVYGYFKPREKVKIMTSWAAVLTLLKTSHAENTRVAVYPNADIQYF